MHSALIEAANRLYLKTGDTALIRETFEAAEENRASSLRALLEKQRAPELQPAYWEALVRLQRAEVNALRSPGAPAEEAVSAARAELIRLQASDPPGGSPLSGDVLESFRAALPGDTALLSFHLGDSISWLWTLDRRGLSLHRLPPRREIETRVQGAAEAIRDDAPYAGAAGAALYGELFGGVAQRIRQKARWLLALDAGLFDAPFAALPESRAGRGTAPRMIERRALEVIPGAGVWLDAAARRRAGPPSGLFLGVGDPVYNPADPRAVHAPLRRNWPFTALAATAGDLAIPRLVASGTELDVCARAWGG
ncbi:MAG: hypothetical protein LAQ30_27550, partial [Acidobacteriia bacterium]|nr:hypothetical protein [Terriglobia bacterium]